MKFNPHHYGIITHTANKVRESLYYSEGVRAGLESDPGERGAIVAKFFNTLDPKTHSAAEVIEAFKQFTAGQQAAHKLIGCP